MSSQAASLRLIVDLQVDPSEHGAFLDSLGELRRNRDSAGFREALGAYRAALHQNASELTERIARSGGTVVDDLWLTPALIVENGSQKLVDELGPRARVDSSGTRDFRGPNGLTEALDAFHHDAQGANALSVGGVPVEGVGVTLALVDSGVELSIPSENRPHRAYYQDANPQINSGGVGGSRILSAEGVPFPGSPPVVSGDGDDNNGHGTRVASFAMGAAFAPGVAGVGDGVAPSAFLRSVEMTADQPSGIAAVGSMVRAFELVATYPDVVVANMSYDGTPFACGEPSPTIDAAVRTGIVVTLSAGQNGSGSIMHGTYNAIPVGASFLGSKEAYAAGPFFTSAVGPLPDQRKYPLILAVGEELTGATLDFEDTAVNSYGTSGSAAIVAGTAILMRQVAPWLTALEVKAILLNTAQVSGVAGDPNATGFGYLQTKVAVEAAQAGDVTTRVVQGLERASWSIAMAAGEPLAVTAVWERTGVFSGASPLCFGSFETIPRPAIADVDLVLKDENDTVVASSYSGFDNVESVRFVAPQAGTYTLEVDVLAHESGQSTVEYVLAGIRGTPSGVDSLPCNFQAPSLSSTQSGELKLSLISKPTRTIVKGCGLAGTSGVTVGGFPAEFAVYSARAVEVEIPYGLSAGVHPVVLELPGGLQLTSNLILAVSTPVLSAPYDVAAPSVPLGGGQSGTLLLRRNPGEAYGIGVSFAFGDTSIPGIVDLNIGGGNPAAIGTLQAGVFDSNGAATFVVEPKSVVGLPVGSKIYFQGVVFDLDSLQLIPSNAGTTLVAFPI